MNTIVQETRVAWRSLVCDPSHSGFQNQKVAPATDDCPAGSSVQDDVWHFPVELAGSASPPTRRINWRTKVGKSQFLTDPQFNSLLTMSKSYALLKMRYPGRRRQRLATIKLRVAPLIKLAKFVANTPWKAGRKRLDQLTTADATSYLDLAVSGLDAGGPGYRRLRLIFRDIQNLAKKGLLNDCFTDEVFAVLMQRFETVSEAEFDWTEYSATPYSNEYCLGLLEVFDFYNDHLAGDICAHVVKLKELWEDEDKLRRDGEAPNHWEKGSAPERYKEFASTYEWKVKTLPFPHDYAFPPVTTGQFREVVSSLQFAIMQVVDLSTAAREGELLSTLPGCLSKLLVEEKEVDLISSKRFKTSGTLGGYAVGWPVSPRVADAIRTQEKLARAAGNTVLWISFRRGFSGRITESTAPHIQRFAELHRLDIGPEGRAYMQRFRPTVALLMSLGPDGHPHLAKRALGHRSLQTTINYLRMNPKLQVDLAYNLHPDRAVVDPSHSARTVDLRPSEPDPAELAATIAYQESLGKIARLIGPGIISFSDPLSDDHDFMCFTVYWAALAFSLKSLTNRRVQKVPKLFGWFASEAARIAAACREAEMEVVSDPRSKALLAMAQKRASTPTAA